MNNSLDHQIVTTLATLLGRISVTNGFATEAGAYVVTEEQRAKIPESAGCV